MNTMQESKPLVTVVIPTHNRAALLESAIASTSTQEGAGQLFDIEVIVVDDASTDATHAVVKKYPWVRYIKLPKNRGASGARNEGIKAATGKYVSFLDDDDEFLTHKLLIQVPLLEADPELGVVYGQSVVTGGPNLLELWPLTGPSGRVFEKFLTLTDDFLHPSTWLIRRELFEKAGYFDETKSGMEHYDMALRIAFLAPWFFVSGGPVAKGHFSNEGLWYRNIVNGVMERQLPLIVERALAMLPDTAAADLVRRQARVSVCATIAFHRWHNRGGLEPLRTYLLETLRTSPWMLTEPAIQTHVLQVARGLVQRSTEPVEAIMAFWDEMKSVMGVQGIKQKIRMRRLFSDLLNEAALELKSTGSPRKAILVALNGVARDPTQLMRKGRKDKVFTVLFHDAIARLPESWRKQRDSDA